MQPDPWATAEFRASLVGRADVAPGWLEALADPSRVDQARLGAGWAAFKAAGPVDPIADLIYRRALGEIAGGRLRPGELEDSVHTLALVAHKELWLRRGPGPN